jgi:hypothetical protein
MPEIFSKEGWKIFCNVNCKTPNVVDLLDCHVCGSQYVGESVQPFNKRMNGHRSDLTKKTFLAVRLQKILYSFPVVLLWNTCARCHWGQHLQRLSPHDLHWPTVDEGLDTVALTSVSNTFHPVVALLSTVLRVSHSANPLGLWQNEFAPLLKPPSKD